MLGRILVFTTPRTLVLCLRGFDLYQRRGVLCIPGEKWLFFFIFWREIYEKSVRYPLSFPRSEGHQSDKKGSKNHQKRLQKLAFYGSFWCFFSQGDLGQYFFLVLWPIKSIGTNIGMKKKSFEIFVKMPIFLMNLSKKLTVCCKWLWNPSKWCR